MNRHDVRIGQRVRIEDGWSYTLFDPLEGRTSDGTVTGIVVRHHDHPGTVYLSVGNRRASAAIMALEESEVTE